VILLEKVKNLGNLGEKVHVKPGYARNFLLPRSKAVRASADALKQFEARRAELEAKAEKILAEAQKRHTALSGQRYVIEARASEEGRLFGSVSLADIAKVITAAGSTVTKGEVRIENGPIRTVGDYEVDVLLHPEVTVRVILAVQAA